MSKDKPLVEMSLRDYFACVAMAAMRLDKMASRDREGDLIEAAANAAYDYADAMLQVREERK